MGGFGGSEHPLGMVGWCVVPNQQLGHLGAHLGKLLKKGDAVVLATALTHQVDQFAGLRVEGPMDHPPPVAPRNDHPPLLAPSRPPPPHRRKPPPCRFLPAPPPPPARPLPPPFL